MNPYLRVIVDSAGRAGFRHAVSATVARLLWPLLSIAVLAAVGVIAWAGQANASHSSDALHICVDQVGGKLRVGEDCKPNEDAHALVTEAGLKAAEDRIATLEAKVSSLQSDLLSANDRIDILEDRVDLLEADNTDLQATLDGVRRTTVDGRDTLRFEAMNLQVANGTETTDGTPNGLGNLLIGYSAPRDGSDPAVDRNGSHYLIVGDQHRWTSFGGIVAGRRSTATAEWASVTGGVGNVASGAYSSVTGGSLNTASNGSATVAGGAYNNASGFSSSVTGGEENTASSYAASVTGGELNIASVDAASVTGGTRNTASGHSSSVTGGRFNTAKSGGSVTGGRFNVASGVYSSVTGGLRNEAGSEHSSVVGGLDGTVDTPGYSRIGDTVFSD